MKKKIALCLALVALIFSLSACVKSKPISGTPTPTPPTAGDKQPDSGGTGDKETPEKVPSGGTISAGETGGKTKSDNFSYKEIKSVFSLTKADITALYGAPVKVTKSDFEGEKVETLEFATAFFDVDFTTDPKNGKVFNASIKDDRILAPRGLKIGDPIEKIVGMFPYGGDRTVVSEGDEKGYVKLYGDPATNKDYGIIQVVGETPIRVIYENEMTSVTYNFTKGMLTAVNYTLMIN